MQCKAKFRDLNTNKEFWLKFGCEIDRDNFIRKLRFSKKLVKEECFMKITIDKVLELLDLYEFDLMYNTDGTLSVIDRQRANLGGIEEDTFNTLAEVLDRMDAYHNDYIVNGLEERADYDYKDWEDLCNYCKNNKEIYDECKWDIDMLDMIVSAYNECEDVK